MSLIAGDGWALFFIVLSFLLVIEFTTNMVLEPRLYGSGIGLTETATVVMVSFWTWLWGPLGLLVGMPLTATLSVFARYVPGMQAFNTLFGAEAAMDVHLSVYQRILAGRLDEALDLVEPGAEPGTGVYRAFDALLLPALARAQADYQAGVLSRTELADFNAAAQSLIQELAALQAPAVPREIRVLPAYPGRGEVNTLALDMLDHSLALDGLRLRVLPRSDAVAAAADAVRAQQSGMLLVSSFAPGSASHARQLCQRLRASQPNLYIIVGRWVAAEEDTEARALLRAAGADIVVATLEEARAAVLGHVGAEPMPLTEADAVAVLAT